MLETKERDTLRARPHPESHDPVEAIGPAAEQGRSEMVIVIGVVSVVSMAFGFVIGLLF
jgi:hypothetical protein